MICAAHVTTSDLGEVAVVMHATTSDDYCYIHRGVKVRKNHTSRRDAFQSVNYPPLGKVWTDGRIEWIAERFKRGERELILRDRLEEKVVLIKFHPNLPPDIMEFFYDKGYRGFCPRRNWIRSRFYRLDRYSKEDSGGQRCCHDIPVPLGSDLRQGL